MFLDPRSGVLCALCGKALNLNEIEWLTKVDYLKVNSLKIKKLRYVVLEPYCKKCAVTILL